MGSDSGSSQSKSFSWSGIVRKTRKVMYLILTLAIVLGGVYIYWKYFYTYSEGYRAGLLQKFSRKGTFFKTYEAEMILSSVASKTNIAIASEKFYFSVTDENLVPKLDTIQGQNIIVHYIQKNSSVFWRGDSQYLVDSVRVKKDL